MKTRFHRILALAGVIFLGANCLCAQTFLYDVDFVFDFDNREVYHPYEESGTLFGVRLTPTIGVGFTDSVGGTHQLIAGVSYVQPFGSNWRQSRLSPTVYYQMDWRGFRLDFGFVPYRFLTESLPDYLRSDSLAFAYPNIQGALLQYRSQHGYIDVLADWRGMMDADTREAFRLVAGGKYRWQWLYMGGYAQLNHLSHSTQVKGVCDDIVVNPLVGVSVGQYTPLDSIALQAGYLFGWQRDRKADESYLCHGLHLDMLVRWRFIGLRDECYIGDNQMPLYSSYGPLHNQGDPRYQAHIYNRTDLYLYLIRRSFVTAYFGWNLLYTQGYGVSHQQQLVCRFNLDQVRRYTGKHSLRVDASPRSALLNTLTYR